MRGDLLLKFLELIGEAGGEFEDHFVGFLKAGYGASMSGLDYEAAKNRRQREKIKAQAEENKKLWQRYYVMKSSLKKDELINEVRCRNKKRLVLTQKGRFKLRQLNKDAANHFVIPGYKLESGSRVIIVAFDIPEEDRQKRAWLRSVLKNFRFKMVQRSVWVGKGVLPQRFLDDLKKMRLVDFVEIFEVTKSGSLAHIF